MRCSQANRAWWYWVFSYGSTCGNLDPVVGTQGDWDFKADALDRSLVSDTWVNEIRWHNGVQESKDKIKLWKINFTCSEILLCQRMYIVSSGKKVPEDSLQIISWG